MIELVLDFQYPDRLWALLALPLVALLYLMLSGRTPPRPRNRLSRVLPQQAAWKRHLAVLMSLSSLAMLVVAWAIPSGYGRQPRERATVVLTIDVSWSMEAEDVEPNRFAAAKDSASAFIRSLPRGFNVALVAFAGTAQLVVPPTTDHNAVERAVNSLELAPSTAIGEGIHTSLNALALVPPDPAHPDEVAPAVIVLLSDGATNLGRDSINAATHSAELGVPIYTIAYGTEDGVVIDKEGRTQRVPVDHYELREVAKKSGGKKFAAESASELKETYEAISQSVGYEDVLVEITDQYAGYALVFAVLAALGVISLGARWP
ncbi:VWA domain-containing protein [Tessaracoccus sp. OH4464_COT-324]|uniref:VWA domain-containing protein n=1 Tax=Tessaracoccus sp. OH4464_COT-324 TaxID=2491059 RepID=UPI000F63D1E9|nr:VWA domain-containing protein [Tessaracoccus sp. OH4464_COT-324]RRD47848.1 VWA domain-containing protein [Tessaracoccus sp. OH4464_COT-324]